jgi:hypothetical protein
MPWAPTPHGSVLFCTPSEPRTGVCCDEPRGIAVGAPVARILSRSIVIHECRMVRIRPFDGAGNNATPASLTFVLFRMVQFRTIQTPLARLPAVHLARAPPWTARYLMRRALNSQPSPRGLRPSSSSAGNSVSIFR